MSYHPLTEDSGSSPLERREEANRLLNMLEELDLDETSPNERAFLEKMFSNYSQSISAKQLFWLRDIKDRAL